MQINACRQTNSSSTSNSTVTELVARVTSEEFDNLRRFAARRIARLQTHPNAERLLANWSAEDLIHTVITKFLIGERHPKKGRHLPERHRQNTTVFLQALMGAINSELSNLIRGAEAASAHVRLGNTEHESGTVEPASPVDCRRRLERRDLTRELIHRREDGQEIDVVLTLSRTRRAGQPALILTSAGEVELH